MVRVSHESFDGFLNIFHHRAAGAHALDPAQLAQFGR